MSDLRPTALLTGIATAALCVLTGVLGSGLFAGGAIAQVPETDRPQEAPEPATDTALPAAQGPTEAVPVVGDDRRDAGGNAAAEASPAPASDTDNAALASAASLLDEGVEAYNDGQAAAATVALEGALAVAPTNMAGDELALEAARRLGYIALEARNPRDAEVYFASEAVLARRLYFRQSISAGRFSDAIGRWASASGSMGRSSESAALVFYAREIRRRAQAAASAEALDRDANFGADAMTTVRVTLGELCVTERQAVPATRVTCEDEAGARREALQMQARQIKANAPPPPTIEERAAKAKERKASGGRPR